MKVLWERSPRTANEIIEVIEPLTGWNPRTTRTLLNRLLKKKALRFKTAGREYLYAPNVEERECVRAESRSFLDRMFGGSLKPMLVSLLEHKDLSRREIDELRNILEEKGRNS